MDPVSIAAAAAAAPKVVEGAKDVYSALDKLFGGGKGKPKHVRQAEFRALMTDALQKAQAFAEAGAVEASDAKAALAFAEADGRLNACAILLKHPMAKLMGSELQRDWEPKVAAITVYVEALKKERAEGGPEAAEKVTFDWNPPAELFRKAAAAGDAGPEMQTKALEDYPYLEAWVMSEHPDRAPEWLRAKYQKLGALLGSSGGAGAGSSWGQDITGGFKITTGTIVAVVLAYLAFRWFSKR